MKKILFLSLVFHSLSFTSSKKWHNADIINFVMDEQHYFDDIHPIQGHFNSPRNRDNVNITLLHSWGEYYENVPQTFVEIDDNLLAYNDNEILVIQDVTDPLNPITLSETQMSGVPYWGTFRKRNNILYACNSYSGLDIIDVSDPTNPLILSHVDTEGRAYDIAFQDNFAFLAARQAGILILDISDASNPDILNTYNPNQNFTIDAVAILDEFLVYGDRNGNVTILNIEDIYALEQVTSLTLDAGSTIWELNVAGNIIDILQLYPEKYHKLNFSDNTLTHLGEIEINNSYGFARNGDYIHIPTEEVRYDIYSPLGHSEIVVESAWSPSNLSLYDAKMISDHLYASSYYGYTVFDVSDNSSQFELTSYNHVDGSASDLVVNESALMVNSHVENSIKIFTNADGDLNERSEIINENVNQYHGIYAKGHNLILLSGNRIIWYDITDVDNPIFLDDYYGDENYGDYQKVAFTSTYFIAGKTYENDNGSFDIFSFNENNEIEFLNNLLFDDNSLSIGWNGRSMALIEDTNSDKIFIMPQTGTNYELREINSELISDPLLQNIEAPNFYDGELGYDVDQGYLYLLSLNSDFIYVINLSNPDSYSTVPIFEGTSVTTGPSQTIDVEFPYVYHRSNNTSELLVFDISNNDLNIVGSSNEIPFNFLAEETMIYSHGQGGEGGFRIYELDGSPLQLQYAEIDISNIDYSRVYKNEFAIDSVIIYNTSESTELEIFDITINSDAFYIEDAIPMYIDPLDSLVIHIYVNSSDQIYGGHDGNLVIHNGSINNPYFYVTLSCFIDIPSEPRIVSIDDIPDDQGGQVRITFNASKWDIIDYNLFESVGDTGAYHNIQSYSIWRHLSGDEWDAIGSFDAINGETYNFVSPTLCDSTISFGDCWSKFSVSAHHGANTFWFSEIDSGYSVDNIAPEVPSGFMISLADNSLELSWSAVSDEDFQYYVIDKSADPLFETDQYGSFHTTELSLIDPDYYAGNIVYYRLAAIDYAGNRGNNTVTISTSALSLEMENVPNTFSLQQNYPNPFNPSTTLQYELPNDEFVNIIIYDMLGNVINNLVHDNQNSGYKSVQWDATNNQGQQVSAGVYLYSIEAGDFRQTKKMILLK